MKVVLEAMKCKGTQITEIESQKKLKEVSFTRTHCNSQSGGLARSREKRREVQFPVWNEKSFKSNGIYIIPVCVLVCVDVIDSKTP